MIGYYLFLHHYRVLLAVYWFLSDFRKRERVFLFACEVPYSLLLVVHRSLFLVYQSKILTHSEFFSYLFTSKTRFYFTNIPSYSYSDKFTIMHFLQLVSGRRNIDRLLTYLYFCYKHSNMPISSIDTHFNLFSNTKFLSFWGMLKILF